MIVYIDDWVIKDNYSLICLKLERQNCVDAKLSKF